MLTRCQCLQPRVRSRKPDYYTTEEVRLAAAAYARLLEAARSGGGAAFFATAQECDDAILKLTRALELTQLALVMLGVPVPAGCAGGHC